MRCWIPPPQYRKRKIFVVCNDTLCENPVIQAYVDTVLEKIKAAALAQGLPFFVYKSKPLLGETFWVNVIGRGYPVPNNSFRWCTDRLKIQPTTRFILERVKEDGRAIVLVGTRRGESQTRARSIARHERVGSRLSQHPAHPNTSVYSPIKELSLEEVWWVINAIKSPWGATNDILYKIYADASADDYECPTMISDKKHMSCGQSRFGCWTCTVVDEDKSLMALVDKGYDWLKPLLDLRNKLYQERNDVKNRMPIRRNGKPAVSEDGRNFGVYTPEYRIKILKALLLVQKGISQTQRNVCVISTTELIAIQTVWLSDFAKNEAFAFKKTVSEIYSEVFKNVSRTKMNEQEKHDEEQSLLLQACGNDEKKRALINEILRLYKAKDFLLRKNGLDADILGAIEKYNNDKNTKD